MSIFHPVSMSCPHCAKPLEFQASASVNADRRPDLRSAILDGSFQRENCRHCGERFRVEPALNYLDVGRGQWIAVFPADWLDRWPELERSSVDAFAQAFGGQASEAAREIGDTLKPRVVFGWLALTEKLLAAEAGLDDATLELTKLALMRGLDEPLAVGEQLRLTGSDDDSLSFLIVGRDGSEDDDAEELSVPRALYDEVAAEAEDWKGLRDKLAAGLLVDVARMTRGSEDD